MPRYKAWFDHHDGPYFILIEADKPQNIEEWFTDDPFFLDVTGMDDDHIPCGSLALEIESAEAAGVDWRQWFGTGDE